MSRIRHHKTHIIDDANHLQLRVVDADTTSSQFQSIQHQVIYNVSREMVVVVVVVVVVVRGCCWWWWEGRRTVEGSQGGKGKCSLHQRLRQ